MAKLTHGAHECVLTSPEIIANGICNICFKDEPIEFACDPCNFDLCRSCSKPPLKVSHDFHPEHPLEICVGKKDDTKRYKLCSWCGDLFSETLYYKCKDCEIYLELGCAILGNISTCWDAKTTLHYCHAHLLQRCKPGPDARGSCLMCELPLTPSAICYGCDKCYLFVHERCLALPRKIHHSVHPKHPLKRLDFTHTCGPGKYCDACGLRIDGAPLGCVDCNFNLHLRCADSLLRGLMHKSHHHMLFYVPNSRESRDNIKLYYRSGCGICNSWLSGDYSYYHCVECGWWTHLECLGIPEYVVKKSHHIHPLVCKMFLPEDNSMAYCDVCETILHAGHHAYCCKECDFAGHLQCLLNEEKPSPLYLKELYSCGKNDTRLANKDHECENKLVINDIKHNHVMIFNDVTEYLTSCGICRGSIHGTILWICKTCGLRAHDSCVKLRQQSKYRFHLNHPLTLLPSYPAGTIINCDTCKETISSFNLFCRICNFIICTKCMVRAKKFLGELQRGQKFIRYDKGMCLRGRHTLVQVMVSRSYPLACSICIDMLCGKVFSCAECEEIYHSRCIDLARVQTINHPLHFDHGLYMTLKNGAKCIACKLDITKYGFSCDTCLVSFHSKCIEAIGVSRKMEDHEHYLYNFWKEVSSSARSCTVCKEPCGASFYGCNSCDLKAAHVECIGFPEKVKNQQHQHTVMLMFIYAKKKCALCGLDMESSQRTFLYSCFQCEQVFHKECILSMDDREAATEEEQINEIYLMYIEQNLFNLIKDEWFSDDSDWGEDSDFS